MPIKPEKCLLTEKSQVFVDSSPPGNITTIGLPIRITKNCNSL